MKLMRCVRWDVDSFARAHRRLLPAERGFHFAIEQDESFFKVVPMGRGPPPGGTCMSMTQKRPAVSSPETVIV